MPKPKYISGHTPSCYTIWKYLLYDKKTGDYRAVAEKTYNVDMVPKFDDKEGLSFVTIKPWWEEFDETRHLLGTDVDVNGKKTTHFIHFVISPDPKDNIQPNEFIEYIDEFLDKGFHTQEHSGAYQTAVVLHDDTGILHAHIVVNNPILDNTYVGEGRRLSSYLRNGGQVFDQIWHLGFYLAEKRGWNTFLDKAKADAREALVQNFIRQGKDTEKYAEEIDARIKEIFDRDRAFFEEHPYVDPDVQYIRPNKQIPYGPVKSTRHSGYIKPTEAAFIRKYGWSYKNDLREFIDLAVSLSRDTVDFARILKYYGIEYTVNKKNDYVFKHPDSNSRYRGYGLGRDYTKGAIYKRIKTVYQRAKKQQDWKKHNNYAKALSSPGLVACYHLDSSIKASDLRELIDINMKYNIWKDDEYELNLKYVDKELDPEKYEDLKWASKKIKKIRDPRGFVPREVMKKVQDDIIAMPKRAKDMTDAEIYEKIIRSAREDRIRMAEEAKNRKKRRKQQGRHAYYEEERQPQPEHHEDISEPEQSISR